MNGIVLCAKCHSMSAYAAEIHQIWWAEWLREHKKEQYEWILANMYVNSRKIESYKESFERLEKYYSELSKNKEGIQPIL
jgi:acyl carrier protein phosphodiesterase